MNFFDLSIENVERVFDDEIEYLIGGWDEEIYASVKTVGEMLQLEVYDLDSNHVLGPVEIPSPPGEIFSDPDKLYATLGAVIPALVLAWVRQVEDGDMVETEEIEGCTFRTWKTRT